jgi:hypothetical protein
MSAVLDVGIPTRGEAPMEKGIVERERYSGSTGEIPDHKTGYYTDRKNGYAEAVWGNAPL